MPKYTQEYIKLLPVKRQRTYKRKFEHQNVRQCNRCKRLLPFEADRFVCQLRKDSNTYCVTHMCRECSRLTYKINRKNRLKEADDYMRASLLKQQNDLTYQEALYLIQNGCQCCLKTGEILTQNLYLGAIRYTCNTCHKLISSTLPYVKELSPLFTEIINGKENSTSQEDSFK